MDEAKHTPNAEKTNGDELTNNGASRSISDNISESSRQSYGSKRSVHEDHKVSVNTGRWNESEHRRFLEGLELYGREWKRVASNVGTRSVMQTRTHAQKYFDKLNGKCSIWDTASQSNEQLGKGECMKNLDNRKTTEYLICNDMTEANQGDTGESDSFEQDKCTSHHYKNDVGPLFTNSNSRIAGGDHRNQNFPLSSNVTATSSYPLPYYYGSGFHVAPLQAHRFLTPYYPPISSPCLNNVRPFHSDEPTTTPSLSSTVTPYPSVTGGYDSSGQYFPSYHSISAKAPNGLSPMNFSQGGSKSSDILTVDDILLPLNYTSMQRSSNREFLELLITNAPLFYSLPELDQTWFVRNLCHFMEVMRGRKWYYLTEEHSPYNYQLHCNWNGVHLLVDPTGAVLHEYQQPSLKNAAWKSNPLWILGQHAFDDKVPQRNEKSQHISSAFVYRGKDGSWSDTIPTQQEVREILRVVGPKNMLLLPACIRRQNMSIHRNASSNRENMNDMS